MSNEEKEPSVLSEKERYSVDVNYLRSQLQAFRDKLAAAQAEIARNNEVFNSVTVVLISAIHERANERDKNYRDAAEYAKVAERRREWQKEAEVERDALKAKLEDARKVFRDEIIFYLSRDTSTEYVIARAWLDALSKSQPEQEKS